MDNSKKRCTVIQQKSDRAGIRCSYKSKLSDLQLWILLGLDSCVRNEHCHKKDNKFQNFLCCSSVHHILVLQFQNLIRPSATECLIGKRWVIFSIYLIYCKRWETKLKKTMEVAVEAQSSNLVIVEPRSTTTISVYKCPVIHKR